MAVGGVLRWTDTLIPWIDSVPVLMTLVATIVDLRKREIPDWVVLTILALVPLRTWWLWPQVVLWHVPAGAILAFLIGCIVARNEKFGGGDVKLFAALGAWFGVTAVAPLALWCAIAGLPLALSAAARGKQDFAFGPAIFLGVLIHWCVPDLLGRIGGWN